MFVGPWAMVEGLGAVVVEDRCWTMVEEDKHRALTEEYCHQDALGGQHDNHDDDDQILLLFLGHHREYKRIIK